MLLSVFVFAMLARFTGIGIVTPGFAGWFLYPLLVPFLAMFPLMILGGQLTLAVSVIYLLSFPIAKRVPSHSAWNAKAAQDLKTKGRVSIGASGSR